jgi:D-apionolactonase
MACGAAGTVDSAPTAVDAASHAAALSVGPVSAVLDGTVLRRLAVAGVEFLTSVYFAVRDVRWETVAPELIERRLETGTGSFTASFALRHKVGGGELESRVLISGDISGTVSYEFDSVVTSALEANRIGLCVLHPVSLAGRVVTFETVAGPVTRHFPVRVAPWPLCTGITGLRYRVATGAAVNVALAGDVFEMEDQRNWTDGSYKIYSRPLSAPRPVRLVPGERVRQSVSVTLTLRRPPSPTKRLRRIEEVHVDADHVGPAPRVGFGAALLGRAMDDEERRLIAALHPGHVRVEADPGRIGWGEALREADQAAAELSCGLYVDVVTDSEGDELQQLSSALRDIGSPIDRVFVYDRRLHVTTERVATRAAALLKRIGVATRLCGGTRSNFAHLNRVPVPLQSLACIGYAINPQVHTFDDQSIVETLAGQAATVASARAIAGPLPLAVGPVTLLPTYNPFGRNGDGQPAADGLPATVDPRQRTDFLAAWTIGSLGALLPGGVSAITYYETLGWRGLVETADGPRQPSLFSSAPLEIFPVYHVFAAIGGVISSPGAQVLPTRSPAGSGLHACAVRAQNEAVVLLANLGDDAKTVRVHLPREFQWKNRPISDSGEGTAGSGLGLDVRAPLALPGRSAVLLSGRAR